MPMTKRERTEYLHPPFNIRLGRELGCNLMLIYVMALSFAVVSPIILPFTLLFFLENWVVWRYQMLYTFERSYESGGMVPSLLTASALRHFLLKPRSGNKRCPVLNLFSEGCSPRASGLFSVERVMWSVVGHNGRRQNCLEED